MATSSSLSPARVRLASMQHRVLIYLTCYNVLDGVTLTIRKLEQEILAAGHHVCILTTVSGDPANTNLDGSHPNRTVIFMDNAIPIPFLRDADRPELSYQLGFQLSLAVKQQIDEFEPSIIHITVPDCTSMHVIQYARKKEIPMMGTYHSNIPEYMEHYPGLSWLKHILAALFRHQYNYLQALYVPTPYIQKHLVDSYKMDRVTSLKVWGRGVDVDKFNPAYRSLRYRRDLGIADDATVVLWVGRLVPEKRPDIFANVVRRLYARGLNFHALVVGAGPCEAEIQSLPNTTFAGWMSTDQLSTAYASSDVFLFPSAVETFGNVTLEAASSGLPVIVEAGCSGHLVHDGENGYTASAGDEDAFFEATLALVEDRQMREEFSVNSREMAFSLEKRTVVRQMLENYNKITDEFFADYSGRHSNRDSVYTQPDSFRMGKIPRPLMLIFVEYLFIFVFMVCWQLTSCYSFVAKRCGRKRTSSPKENKVPSPPSTSPSRFLKEKQAAIDHTSPNNMSVVELDNLELGNCSKEPLLSSDDNTATTTSSSHASSRSTMQSLGDCRLSHTLAKIFVETVEFQCRLESHVRLSISSMFKESGSQFSTGGPAKRKNSSMAVSLSDMADRPDQILRNRSDLCSEVETGLLPSVEDNSPTNESHLMRRTQATAIDVY